MKRFSMIFLVFTLSILLGVNIQAQSRFSVGLLGGISAGATGDEEWQSEARIIDPKPGTGSTFGVFADIKLISPIYISAQFIFTSNKDEWGTGSSDDLLTTSTRTFSYTEIPLLLKLKLGGFYVFYGPTSGTISAAEDGDGNDLLSSMNESYSATTIGAGLEMGGKGKLSLLVDVRFVSSPDNFFKDGDDNNDPLFTKLTRGGLHVLGGLKYNF